MYKFELKPNCALSNRAARRLFLAVAAVCLAIAGAFAAMGFWPILPFAGLELSVLAGGLYWNLRQGRRLELIQIDEKQVLIRKTGHPDEEIAFVRHWTHVDLVPAKARNWPARLILRSMGRRVEVGDFLTDTERAQLRDRLAVLIRDNSTATFANDGNENDN